MDGTRREQRFSKCRIKPRYYQFIQWWLQVIAAHKRPGNDDNPRIIEEARQYIRDFDRLAEITTTAQELFKVQRSCNDSIGRMHSKHN
jgi:hypothetical protein